MAESDKRALELLEKMSAQLDGIEKELGRARRREKKKVKGETPKEKAPAKPGTE